MKRLDSKGNKEGGGTLISDAASSARVCSKGEGPCKPRMYWKSWRRRTQPNGRLSGSVEKKRRFAFWGYPRVIWCSSAHTGE
jgi:hypothetical protein